MGCSYLGSMERTDLRARTILVLATAALFLWMVRSLLVPIVLGAVFALLLHPVHVWLQRRLGRAHKLSPLIITTASLILVVLPLAVITAHAVGSINTFLTNLDSSDVSEIQTTIVSRTRELAKGLGIPIQEIRNGVTQTIQRAGNSIATFLSGLLSSVPEAAIDIFLFVVALYFLLRDGPRVGKQLYILSPFSEGETSALFDSVLGTVRGAVLGTVAVAVVQGVETVIALQIFGVPGAVLFGVIAAFLSLVPVIGTMPVTVGAVIYLFAHDRTGAAIGMAIAALVIGTSDNFVRPIIQSREGGMHPLMAMLGIFGGLAVMGPAGIFIGPIVSALVLWMVKFLMRKQRENKQALPAT